MAATRAAAAAVFAAALGLLFARTSGSSDEDEEAESLPPPPQQRGGQAAASASNGAIGTISNLASSIRGNVCSLADAKALVAQGGLPQQVPAAAARVRPCSRSQEAAAELTHEPASQAAALAAPSRPRHLPGLVQPALARPRRDRGRSLAHRGRRRCLASLMQPPPRPMHRPTTALARAAVSAPGVRASRGFGEVH